MAQTAFDGASTEYRLARKGLLSGSADQIAARELSLLLRRSHHLCRNNAAAVTAKNRLTAHWVGTGIKVKWNNKKMQKLWDSFAANPNIDGWGDLYNLQNIWAGTFFESGEVLTRMIIQQNKGQVVPLKLQTLEPEFLDPAYFSAPNTKFGITFDDFGKPITYHFWKRHPNDFTMSGGGNVRVPVSASDVLHLFSRERPGQWRGIPKLTSVMLPLYEMDELTDATLVRQKAAQAIGWIIKKKEAGPLPLIGGLKTEEQPVDEETGKKKKIQKILPGGVHYLQPDEDFIFASVDDIGSNLVTLLQHEWHTIASALDVTYEQLTGDLTNVNFSSIRAGLIEFRRRVAVIQQLVLINLGLKPLTERFKELAAVYSSASAEKATCKFVLPKTEWVDPLKDAQADLLEIRAGLATLQEKLAERGVEDFDEHVAQLAAEQSLDIVLDSNPKKAASVSKGTKGSGSSNNSGDNKNASNSKSKTDPATED
jgi:lambda family phage portal protein